MTLSGDRGYTEPKVTPLIAYFVWSSVGNNKRHYLLSEEAKESRNFAQLRSWKCVSVISSGDILSEVYEFSLNQRRVNSPQGANAFHSKNDTMGDS